MSKGDPMQALHEKLERQSALLVITLSMLLVSIVGFFDYLTGYEISFFIFYAIPIGFSSWYGGKKIGLFSTFASGIAWYIADLSTGHEYSHPLIPYWNGTIRFCFFIFIVYALSNIKRRLELEILNADHDSLTGLLNGRGFRGRIETLLPLVKRDRPICAIAFIDVDNFKQVNDSMGHAAGDEVLMETAKAMKAALRSSDVIARLGGDEFVIFFPGADMAQAKIVLEELRRKLSIVVKTYNWPIGFSIGVEIFNSKETAIEKALADADLLMYEVKKQGKGRILYKENLLQAA